MDRSLVGKALMKFSITFTLACLLLFLPAGTMAYPNGWLFLSLLFIPMVSIGAVLLAKNPELLKKRLESKETQSEQVIVTQLTGLVIVAGLVSSGLDFRFGWTSVPKWMVVVASALFLGGYSLWVVVLRENPFLGRSVSVEKDQLLVDTGPYKYVRHPMYSASIILFLSLPLVLGSQVSFGLFLLYPLLMARRIKGEEKLLTSELAGYSAYCKRVRYRLIPFIW